MDLNKVQYLMERIVISGPLTTSEKQSREQLKKERVDHLIENWFSNPDFFVQLFIWDADIQEWHQNISRNELLQMTDEYETIIWSQENESNQKIELIKGIITVRQTFKSLNEMETVSWNLFKEQMATKLNIILPPEAMSCKGFPSKLLFISDLLRKLYHCYAGEIDFGGNIGKCGIRLPLFHTTEWEMYFTELLRQKAPLTEVLASFTLEQLLYYGW